MRKNMKKIVAGALLTSTLGMTACEFLPSATVKSVEVNSIDTQTYQVYDQFDATKYVLDVTMSDGTTKTVNVTADMIETMPDMTTSGEKTIKVKYEDKLYELKINVGGYSKEEMLAKIQAFLEDYNAVTNAGDIKATINASYLARYMDKVAQGEAPTGQVELNQTLTGNDALLNFLYSAIVGSLTNSSDGLTVSDINNSNELTAQLDALQVLKNLGEGLLKFDYLDYLADVVLEPTMFNSLVANTTDMIMQYFVLDESARLDVTSFVNLNIRDFMNYLKALDFENPTQFDFYSVIEDFNDLVQEYCSDQEIKDGIQSAITTLDSADKNVLSTFIKNIANEDIRILYFTKKVWKDNPGIIPEGGYWGFEISNEATTIELEDNIILSVAGVLETIENIVANFFEEEPVEIGTLMTTLTEKLDSYAGYQEQIGELGLTTPSTLLDMSFMIASTISGNIKDYQSSQDFIDYAIKTIKNNALVEMLVYSVFNNMQLEDDVNFALQEIITKLVYDVIDSVYSQTPFTPSSEDYLANICTALGITDTNKIIAYTNEWAETGFCSVVSDYLQDTIPNGENDEFVGIKSSVVNVVKYLENCLRTNENKEDFEFKEVLTFANNLFTAMYDINKAEYDDLVANPPSNEPLQPGEMGNLVDYNTQLENYESTLKQIQLSIILTNPESSMLENINTAISTYKQYVKALLANTATLVMGIEPYIYEENNGLSYAYENTMYEVVFTKNSLLADYAVEKYLSNQLDMGYVLDEFFNTVDTYCDENRKIVINSLAIATMIGIGSQYDMDFNEVFDFIKLPDAIEAIDYNKLVDTFYDVETYKNMFNVSKVDVKYETNTLGEIAKEIMQIEFNFNYDLKITELKANLTLNVEITF